MNPWLYLLSTICAHSCNFPTPQDVIMKMTGMRIIVMSTRFGDKKGRMLAQGSGSNNCQRFSSNQDYQQRFQGLVNQWNRNQQPQRFQNQSQSGNQHPPFQQRNHNQQQHGQQTPRSGNSNANSTKRSASNTPTRCFRCEKEGHMSYDCPEKFNPQYNDRRSTPNSAKVNNVAAETVQEGLYQFHIVAP